MKDVTVVRCRCGKLKQEGFICDFCFSTADTRHVRIIHDEPETTT